MRKIVCHMLFIRSATSSRKVSVISQVYTQDEDPKAPKFESFPSFTRYGCIPRPVLRNKYYKFSQFRSDSVVAQVHRPTFKISNVF